jgi:hypothetical protein
LVGDGRGFVVSAGEYRFVITAAHCLPQHPSPHLANRLRALDVTPSLRGAKNGLALGQSGKTV